MNFDKKHKTISRENPRKTGIAYRRFVTEKHKRKLLKLVSYKKIFIWGM